MCRIKKKDQEDKKRSSQKDELITSEITLMINRFIDELISRSKSAKSTELLMICVLITVDGMIIPYLSISVWARLAT